MRFLSLHWRAAVRRGSYLFLVYQDGDGRILDSGVETSQLNLYFVIVWCCLWELQIERQFVISPLEDGDTTSLGPEFLDQQPLFFLIIHRSLVICTWAKMTIVATAPAGGLKDVAPKGLGRTWKHPRARRTSGIWGCPMGSHPGRPHPHQPQPG
jgi:hypothetical protein